MHNNPEHLRLGATRKGAHLITKAIKYASRRVFVASSQITRLRVVWEVQSRNLPPVQPCHSINASLLPNLFGEAFHEALATLPIQVFIVHYLGDFIFMLPHRHQK